jgi:CheY-like chemotaxis protein
VRNNPQMNKTILIVDDDELVRETIGFLLGRSGYRCHTVRGGEDALELLNSGEKMDLVTTDITNAPMDGVTLLEQLENDFPNIPVLVITARQDRSVALECHSKGVRDFVLKPFGRDQLLKAVHSALKPRPPAVST